MDKERLTVEVTTTPGEARLEMRGDVDIAADETLAAAYATAAAASVRSPRARLHARRTTSTRPGSRSSSGSWPRPGATIARSSREGLSDHYREIFRITRLSDYLTIADPVPAASVHEEAPR